MRLNIMTIGFLRYYTFTLTSEHLTNYLLYLKWISILFFEKYIALSLARHLKPGILPELTTTLWLYQLSHRGPRQFHPLRVIELLVIYLHRSQSGEFALMRFIMSPSVFLVFENPSICRTLI